MILKPITIDISRYPSSLHSILIDANIFDSSCSPEAKVIFIDKESGYFLKSAPKGTLAREAVMTGYFYKKGLAAKIIDYVSDEEHDWLLTKKIQGHDCITAKYIEQPKRLCDIFAERLIHLHSLGFKDCPIQNHTERFLAKAEYNKRADNFDKSNFPDSFGYKCPEEAWKVVKTKGYLLKTETLLHGDYCLPNIILDDWRFSGFIDLDNGGVGDRHVDLFWGIWTLTWNLKTDKYRDRFLDVYGRDKIDEERLLVVAGAEVFG